MSTLISRILRVGVVTSLALVLAGTALDLGGSTGPGHAATLAGLVVLIATPVVRVVASIVSFSRDGDRTYVAITAAVLALLTVSFLLGAAA